jgi:hypothetical protein
LHNFFGQRLIAYNSARQPHHRRGVPIIQLFKRGGIPMCSAAHQLLVSHFSAAHGRVNLLSVGLLDIRSTLAIELLARAQILHESLQQRYCIDKASRLA